MEIGNVVCSTWGGKTQGIGVVIFALNGTCVKVGWIIKPEPYMEEWMPSQIRLATEGEKVMLRLTGKI
jgi:hypothetical protein